LIKPALAGDLTNIKITITDSRPGDAGGTGVGYTLNFTDSNTAVKCIKMVFSTAASGGSSPTGMVTTSAAKGTITGFTGANWTLDNTTNATLKYTYATGEASGGNASIGTTNITNATTTAVYFAQVNTYTNADCSTGATDNGVAAFAIISGVTVSVSVAETLSFAIDLESAANCADTIGGTEITSGISSTAMPFATISPNTFYYGCQKLTVSTNATDGYTTTTKEIDQLELSDNTTEIPDGNCDGTCSETVSTTWTSTADADTGFGYCLDDATGDAAATADATYWAAAAQCDDATPQFKLLPSLEETEAAAAVMQSAAGLTTADITRVGYRINVSSTQTAGSYTNVIIYVTTPQYD